MKSDQYSSENQWILTALRKTLNGENRRATGARNRGSEMLNDGK
jgi:hypothetical protein